MKVTLHKRVVVADGLASDAEREIDLPMAPFVGLQIYGAEWRPRGCDPSDDPVEEVGYDLPTGKVNCYLPWTTSARRPAGAMTGPKRKFATTTAIGS